MKLSEIRVGETYRIVLHEGTPGYNQTKDKYLFSVRTTTGALDVFTDAVIPLREENMFLGREVELEPVTKAIKFLTPS